MNASTVAGPWQALLPGIGIFAVVVVYLWIITVWTRHNLRSLRTRRVQRLPVALRVMGLSFAAIPVVLIVVAVLRPPWVEAGWLLVLAVLLIPVSVIITILVLRPKVVFSGETIWVRPMVRRTRILRACESELVSESRMGAFDYVVFWCTGSPLIWFYKDALAPRVPAAFSYFAHQATLRRRQLASSNVQRFTPDPHYVFEDGSEAVWGDAPRMLTLDVLVSAQGVQDRHDSARSGLHEFLTALPAHPAPPRGSEVAATVDGHLWVAVRPHASGEGMVVTITSDRADAPHAVQAVYDHLLSVMAQAVLADLRRRQPEVPREVEDVLDPFVISWRERWHPLTGPAPAPAAGPVPAPALGPTG